MYSFCKNYKKGQISKNSLLTAFHTVSLDGTAHQITGFFSESLGTTSNHLSFWLDDV